MIRIFYACLLLSLGLAAMSLYGGVEQGDLLRYVAQVVVALQIGMIALVAPSLTSAAVSSEIENGTWELLRLTPRGGGEIFVGKLLPVAAFPRCCRCSRCCRRTVRCVPSTRLPPLLRRASCRSCCWRCCSAAWSG